MLAVHLDIGDVVLEDSWDVDLAQDTSIPRSTPVFVIGIAERWFSTAASCLMVLCYCEVWGRGKGGMLTSGKVPLEKTLLNEASVKGKRCNREV